MKRKLFFSGLLFSLVITANAQDQAYSFESAEGFTLGAINNQEGWTVVSEDPGEATQSVVSDAQHTAGTRSLKIMGVNGDHGSFWGANSPFFDNPGNKVRLTLDVYIIPPTAGGPKSDIYIGADAPALGNITARIIFNTENKIEINDVLPGGGVGYKETVSYSTGVWYSLRVDFDFVADTIKYYLNNTLILSGTAVGASEVQQLSFKHSNYSNGAYIDNIKIEESTLGTEEHLASKLSVYPNPATDVINISNPQNLAINGVMVTDLNGRTIINQESTNDAETRVYLNGISAGIYSIQINTDKGTSTQKVIKN